MHSALVRRPELFVHVRKNGIMLRSNWEKPPVRYFLTTEEIVQMAREVLDKTRAPIRPAEIIEQFRANGRRISGDELGSLRTVLQKHSEHLEAKGRKYARWILLRPFVESDYVRNCRIGPMEADWSSSRNCGRAVRAIGAAEHPAGYAAKIARQVFPNISAVGDDVVARGETRIAAPGAVFVCILRAR